MSFIIWSVVGLISGFIGSKVVNNAGEGFVLDMLFGVIGAVAGGLLFQWVADIAVNDFNLRSVFVAVIGAVAVLWIKNTIARRKPIRM